MSMFGSGWRRHVVGLIAQLGMGACLAASAMAACGDVNDDASIGVTDGVAVLRGAAGLGGCPLAVCDVDNSGTITVSDGVRVLRAAAGLTVELTCPGAELSAQERQVFGAVHKTTELTGMIELGLMASVTQAAGVTSAATVSCPGGGTVADGSTGVVYDQCRVQDTVCSGTGVRANNGFAPDLQCQDLATGQALEFTGDLTTSNTAFGPAITGTVTGSQNGTAFDMGYRGFTLDENDLGGRSAGEVDIGGAFFTGFFQEVRVFFPGHDPETQEVDPGFADIVGARVFNPTLVVLFAFNLDLETGKLTVKP